MKKLLSSLLFVAYALFAVSSVHALTGKWISYHFCGKPSVEWNMLPHDVHHYSPCGNEHAKKTNKNVDTVSSVTDTVNQSNDTNQPVLDVPSVPANDSTPIVKTRQGNPGNDKPVGQAGEKCNKGMCENSDGASGEQGKSNNG